jgi:hypothetical protein
LPQTYTFLITDEGCHSILQTMTFAAGTGSTADFCDGEGDVVGVVRCIFFIEMGWDSFAK